ncbi:hypothetical protein SteCoe_21414 [Stentor coeruleus]|uniref:Rab-GAP TBC domain-containing protein n=1 Tax=Stentor coeruleus TaxID=5963 RepID=A0A1R2BQ24_9CILI|nr:hypothetical protein SteCoe_21414 [Stentor coeruleus]
MDQTLRGDDSIHSSSITQTQTDLSIDEHIYTHNEGLTSLQNAISYLKEHRNVTYITTQDKKLPISVYLTENLDTLHLTNGKNHTKPLPIREIIELSPCDIFQVVREQDNLYLIRIKTRKKRYNLAFSHVSVRQKWYNSLDTLLKLSQECLGNSAIKNYIETISRTQNTSQSIFVFKEKSRVENMKIKKYQQIIKDYEKQAVAEVVNNMIIQVEKIHFAEKTLLTKSQCNELRMEKESLKKNQDGLKKTLRKKNNEALLLAESLECVKEKVNILIMKMKKSQINLLAWNKIIEFLDFADLQILASVSSRMRRSVLALWANKGHWGVIAVGGLEPRSFSWYVFSNQVVGNSQGLCKSPCDKQKLRMNEMLQVTAKLSADTSLAVKSIVISICEKSQSICCYQDIAKVSEFFYRIFKHEIRSVTVLCSLLGAPHYLAEIWKPGLLRIRMGIFQVQKILKLKLPYLFKHFKAINISLDYIIASWISTVFVCFFRENSSNSALCKIWDYYIVNGWPGIISTCLALLYLSQDKVIGTSLEQTLRYYKKRIKCKDMYNVIKKHEVDNVYLNELEKAFYVSIQD